MGERILTFNLKIIEMNKIKLILATIVCITMIGVNTIFNSNGNNKGTGINLANLEIVATANAEDPPVDDYYYMIGDCIVCTPGSGSCYVFLQCCYNQEPYCD